METDVKIEFRPGRKETTAGRDALRAAQERLERALEKVARGIAPGDMIQALSAPSDEEFLVRVIASSRALATPSVGGGPDPINAARLRGAMIRDRVLASAEMLTSVQFADEIGVRRQTVDNWRKELKVLGLDRGRRGFLYPGWQIENHRVLPGLDKVLAALGPDDPWRGHRFLTSPEPRLADRTPLEVLKEGLIDAVVTAAEQFGDQGGL